MCAGAPLGRYSSITTCHLISDDMEMRPLYILCILSTLADTKAAQLVCHLCLNSAGVRSERQFHSVCIYFICRGFFKGTDLDTADKKINVAVM